MSGAPQSPTCCALITIIPTAFATRALAPARPRSCAVRALDPGGKFRDSAPDRWTWAGVDLKRCCGADGFDASRTGCECRVRHERAKDTCPPPPFYTYR
jgi:hypothetical protein